MITGNFQMDPINVSTEHLTPDIDSMFTGLRTIFSQTDVNGEVIPDSSAFHLRNIAAELYDLYLRRFLAATDPMGLDKNTLGIYWPNHYHQDHFIQFAMNQFGKFMGGLNSPKQGEYTTTQFQGKPAFMTSQTSLYNLTPYVSEDNGNFWGLGQETTTILQPDSFPIQLSKIVFIKV